MDESSELISEDILAQLNSEDNLDVETLVDEVPQPDIESPVLQNSTSPRATSGSPTKPVKYVKLPLSRIKQIMKMDPDVVIVQQDAIFLVTKATEMFIEFLAKECGKQMATNKRKTMMKRDVDVAIESAPQLCFLDGALE